MIRRTLKWCDKQMERSYNEEGITSIARAGMSGFVEGALDGLVLGNIAVFTVGSLALIVNAIKK